MQCNGLHSIPILLYMEVGGVLDAALTDEKTRWKLPTSPQHSDRRAMTFNSLSTHCSLATGTGVWLVRKKMEGRRVCPCGRPLEWCMGSERPSHRQRERHLWWLMAVSHLLFTSPTTNLTRPTTVAAIAQRSPLLPG